MLAFLLALVAAEELRRVAVGAGGQMFAEPAATDDEIRFSVARFQSLVVERSVLTPWQRTGGQGMFVGSGFVVEYDEEGPLVITNAHVINDASAVVMQVPAVGPEQYAVKVVLVNHDMDIALIRLIDDSTIADFKEKIPDTTFKPFTLATEPPKVGTQVHCMGFPLGVESLKLTTGIISGHQVIGGFLSIQMSCPISPGNSGGPLIAANENDEPTRVVLGINYASLEGEGSEQNNFAVPAWRVTQMVNAYKGKGETKDPKVPGQYSKAACEESREMCQVKVPQLAAEILPSTQEMYDHYGCDSGVFVSKVQDHSMLALATPPVLSKSFVTAINGVQVDKDGDAIDKRYSEDPTSFFDLAYQAPDMESAEIKTCTCGVEETHTVSLKWAEENIPPVPFIDEPTFATFDFEVFGDITFGPMTMNAVKQLVGMGAMDLISHITDPSGPKHTLLVTNVEAGGEAAQALQPGSIVHKVNGKAVSTLAELRENFAPEGEVTCAAQEHAQMEEARKEASAGGADDQDVLFGVLETNETNGWTMETVDGSMVVEDYRMQLIMQAHKIRAGAIPVTAGVEGGLQKFAGELKAAQDKAEAKTAKAEAKAGKDAKGADKAVPAKSPEKDVKKDAKDAKDAKAPASLFQSYPTKAADVHAAFAQTKAALQPIEARIGARRGGSLWKPF